MRWLLIAGLFLTDGVAAFAQSSTTTPPPVPEPSGTLLMAVAMGAVAYSAWRQKKNR